MRLLHPDVVKDRGDIADERLEPPPTERHWVTGVDDDPAHSMVIEDDATPLVWRTTPAACGSGFVACAVCRWAMAAHATYALSALARHTPLAAHTDAGK